MSRSASLLLLVGLVAGGPALAAPPRAGQGPVEVQVTQYHQFARIRITLPPWRHPDDARVTAALPAALRAPVAKALAAPAELGRLAGARWQARGARFSCDDPCPKLKQLEQAYDQAEDALTRAAKRTDEQRAAAVAACEKALDRRPAGAVALALARLHEVEVVANDLATDNHPAEMGLEYGETLRESPGGSLAALEAYQKAKAATAPGEEAGAWARYGLAIQHWLKGDAAAARDELAALGPAAPAAWRAEVAFRLAVAHGALGDERAAAAAFAQALAAAGPGDVVAPHELRQGLLLVEYRAGEHRAALARAVALLDAPTGRSRGFGFDRDRVSLERTHVLRLAADCVERLGRARADLSRAAPATRGAILARLALRELYRGDRRAAAATAASALARLPADAPLRALLADLAALARGSLDEPGRKRLRGAVAAELRSRSYALKLLSGRGDTVPEEEELEAALAPDATPVAERRVRSLLRLCLEPAAGWLGRRPEGRGETTLEITTRGVDRGRPVVEVMLPNERALEATSECLSRVGERILPPTPLHATVDLTHAGVTAGERKWREQLRALGKTGPGTALERVLNRRDGVGGPGVRGGRGGAVRGAGAGGIDLGGARGTGVARPGSRVAPVPPPPPDRR